MCFTTVCFACCHWHAAVLDQSIPQPKVFHDSRLWSPSVSATSDLVNKHLTCGRVWTGPTSVNQSALAATLIWLCLWLTPNLECPRWLPCKMGRPQTPSLVLASPTRTGKAWLCFHQKRWSCFPDCIALPVGPGPTCLVLFLAPCEDGVVNCRHVSKPLQRLLVNLLLESKKAGMLT